MRRCFIQADVTAEEKAAVTALALQLGRTESAVVRRAVALYAKTFGAQVAIEDRHRGAQGPLPPSTRRKISESKVRNNVARREAGARR